MPIDQNVSFYNRRLAIWLLQVWRPLSVPISAVLLAALVGAAILALSGASPLQAFGALLQGSLGSMSALGRTLEKATPLVFSGLAVAFAFKAGLFNIGAQGQLLFGAITAAAVGFGVEGLPALIHAPLALLAGALAGALYGALPGALKIFTGAHEVVTTIMLNFVAINITDFLADGPMKYTGQGNIVARTPQILPTAEIPTLGNIPSGFTLGVLVAIVVWWLLWRTTIGFEIRTVGLNPSAARYAGMRVAHTIMLAMLLSGLLAGMGGAIETQGIVGRFQPGFNTNLGFDGITIALLGRTHPFGIVPAALLMGALKAGSSQMQFTAGVSTEIVDIIQALILFFVSADVIVRWITRVRTPDGGQAIAGSGWRQP